MKTALIVIDIQSMPVEEQPSAIEERLLFGKIVLLKPVKRG